ncbi:hypothetical protein [Thiohalomonas denitrificans]|uniref:hypothetical protein n=1 Tax=Thiohalomonas denitrificans TaxID=415747 RepID=UPI0026EEA5C6|nr:hypothetical protein [Thiohalomonas denitrificans]
MFRYFWPLLLSIVAISVHAEESVNLIGEWEQFEAGWENKYTYFRLDADSSGVFATVRGNGEPNIDKFNKGQVSKENGIFKIKFDQGDMRAILMLSGFRPKHETKPGLLTGALYMFEKKNSGFELFNTVFVRLVEIDEHSFVTRINKLHGQLEGRYSRP